MNDDSSAEIDALDIAFNNALRVEVIRELVGCLTITYNIQQLEKIREMSLQLLANNEHFYAPTDLFRQHFRPLSSFVGSVISNFGDPINITRSPSSFNFLTPDDDSDDFRGEGGNDDNGGGLFSDQTENQLTVYSSELIRATFDEKDARDETYVKAILILTLTLSLSLTLTLTVTLTGYPDCHPL